MSNSISYIAFDLSNDVIYQMYLIAQHIKTIIPNFIPMEYDSIHMTVCFLGEVAKRLKSKSKINELVNEYIPDIPVVDKLEFKSFELFGLKQNLIVATFSISNTSQQNIINIQQQCVNKYGAPEHDRIYIPHITLGKISNVNSSNIINIKNLNFPIPELKIITDLKCKIIGL